MKENERPASHTDAEVATALKALLIVLLSTVLLPRVLPLPLSIEKDKQGWEERQPWTSEGHLDNQSQRTLGPRKRRTLHDDLI